MKLDYEKYKKYRGQNLSKFNLKIGERVLIINFNKKNIGIGTITRIFEEEIITDSGMGFNFENDGHNFADFYPLRLLLKEKINK